MNKRQKKKMRDKYERSKALAVLSNLQGTYNVYISKRYFNQGDTNGGYVVNDETGDYIAIDYIRRFGFEYIVHAKNNSHLNLTIKKSWNNKNHLVKR